MQILFYELSVLAKAVQFKNLSAAAVHIGLSQPQLSRIIARIEEELKVVVLDRSAKRKSGWTPVAFELSNLFEASAQKFAAEIKSVSKNDQISELRIGTLEGLTSFALKVAERCFTKIEVKKIQLDIFDLNELDAHFLSGQLDLVLTSKQPGRQKFKYLEEIGFQTLQKYETSKKIGVFSHFEMGLENPKKQSQFKHVLVSNSLAVRKEWLEEIGGTGLLPTEAKRGRATDKEPVLLIGSELLSPLVWKEIRQSTAE